MAYEPISGKPVRLPPGRVEVRLDASHRRLYRTLYANYRTILDGLPILREDRDFDGRPLKITHVQLDALNRAFEAFSAPSSKDIGAFAAQEGQKTRLFKRLQFLS